MEAGGSLKKHCSAVDEEVALGCTGKHCCCAPKDGKLLPMYEYVEILINFSVMKCGVLIILSLIHGIC